MLNRRAFVRRSAAGAAVLLLPAGHRARRRAARRDASARACCPATRRPDGDHAAHASSTTSRAGQRPARGRDRRRVPQGRRARARSPPAPRKGHSVKARIKGLKAHERYYYRFETKTLALADRPLPDRAARRLQRDRALRASSPAPTTRTATTTPTSCWRARTSTSSSASATTSTPRATTPRARPACATTRSARPTATTRRSCARPSTLADYRAKYALYRSDKVLRDLHAKFPMIATWDDHEVQDNYAGDAPGGGLPPPSTTRAARKAGATRRSSRRCRSAAGESRIYRGLRFGKNVDLIMLDQRQYRDDQPCDDATVAALPGLDAPRTSSAARRWTGPSSASRARSAAWKVIGNELMMMNAEVPGGSTSTTTPGRATRPSARSCSPTSRPSGDQGRRLRHRRHPHVHRRRRAHAEEPRRVGRAGVRRRLDHLAVLRRDRPAARRRPGAQGQRRQPEHAAGDHRRPARPQPVGRPGRLRPPRLRARERRPAGLRRHAAARADDQEAVRRRRSPETGFRYTVTRGQTSIKGVNGPPACA